MDEDGHESSIAHMPQLVCSGLEFSDSEAEELSHWQERNKLYKNEFSRKDLQKEW
jgi:hypothetical protein